MIEKTPENNRVRAFVSPRPPDHLTREQPRIGYTRYEFGQIFQIYSRHVYTGLFRDFTFAEIGGRYYLSFREESGQTPLVTIEKQRIGPTRVLFVATTPGPQGRLITIARSEKIGSFIEQLSAAVDRLRQDRL